MTKPKEGKAALDTPANKTVAIFFDFFGVISLARYQLFFETAIPNYSKRQQEFADLGRQHELGYITTDEYFSHISKATGMSVEQCLQQMQSQRVLNIPLLDFIGDQLKPRYKIGMISNAGGDIRIYIDKKYWPLFDEVIISCEVGIIKPDPLIFELACKKLRVLPAEAIMVDDSQDNCEGAKQAGMKAILYTTLEELKENLK